MSPRHLDADACYRAVESRDRRFDGVFFIAVSSTGIYCRPSCPARTPARRNVRFHPTAAAAQSAGFRACKRCLPDATPGSPDWDIAADAAGRAMRLIADGVVDREGVVGLAHRVGYAPRHLTRLLTTELGAGPLALARAQRAQTARVLIETTDLPFADVAFASGFASIRQFNDTIREVYAATPSQLRGRRGGVRPSSGTMSLRIAVRTPFAGLALSRFLAFRAVPGIEEGGDGRYARTLSLPHGPGVMRIDLQDLTEPTGTAFLPVELTLTDLRDTTAAWQRVRRLVDADCDPVAVDESFAADPILGPLVRRTPGLRVPGHVDGDELAVRAVLGQQVSVAGARTIAGRLVAELGERLADPVGSLTHLFPTSSDLAGVDADQLPMPRARGRALVGLARALAHGDVPLDRGTDRGDVRRRLIQLPGIGPWTADYIELRALGHPDIFLTSDLGSRAALAAAGVPAAEVATVAERWRPWRSYAQLRLWHSLSLTPTDEES